MILGWSGGPCSDRNERDRCSVGDRRLIYAFPYEQAVLTRLPSVLADGPPCARLNSSAFSLSPTASPATADMDLPVWRYEPRPFQMVTDHNCGARWIS